MKEVKSFTGKLYKDNTNLEKFLLYKIAYPILNRIGLNRKFNLWRHRMGLYSELPNQLCQWCGENHRTSPLKDYKESLTLTNLEELNKNETL